MQKRLLFLAFYSCPVLPGSYWWSQVSAYRTRSQSYHSNIPGSLLKWLLVGIIGGVALPTQAQWQAGFTTELIQNRVTADYGDQGSIRTLAWPGLGIGITGLYTFKPYFSLQTGLHYARKSQRIQNTGFHDRLYTQINRNYLEVPVGIRLTYPSRKLKGFLSAGTYGAYWLSGRWRSAFYDLAPPLWDAQSATLTNPYGIYLPLTEINEPYRFDQSDQGEGSKNQRWEWGGYAGVGLAIETKWGTPYLEARMVGAFSDLNQSPGDLPMGYAPRKNSSFRLGLGYLLRLKNKE